MFLKLNGLGFFLRVWKGVLETNDAKFIEIPIFILHFPLNSLNTTHP